MWLLSLGLKMFPSASHWWIMDMLGTVHLVNPWTAFCLTLRLSLLHFCGTACIAGTPALWLSLTPKQLRQLWTCPSVLHNVLNVIIPSPCGHAAYSYLLQGTGDTDKEKHIQILFTALVCHGSFPGYLRETAQETFWRQCPTSIFLWTYWSACAALPFISQVQPQYFFLDKLLRVTSGFFCPNPSLSPGRFLPVSLFTLPYSFPTPHDSHVSLQIGCISWIPGILLIQAALSSAFSTDTYQMAALTGLEMRVLVAEPHVFPSNSSQLCVVTGISCQNWQKFSFLCTSFTHTHVLDPICYAGGPLTVYDGVMDCDLGHSCLVCSAVLCYM